MLNAQATESMRQFNPEKAIHFLQSKWESDFSPAHLVLFTLPPEPVFHVLFSQPGHTCCSPELVLVKNGNQL